jgi:hypothetical protein
MQVVHRDIHPVSVAGVVAGFGWTMNEHARDWRRSDRLFYARTSTHESKAIEMRFHFSCTNHLAETGFRASAQRDLARIDAALRVPIMLG